MTLETLTALSYFIFGCALLGYDSIVVYIWWLEDLAAVTQTRVDVASMPARVDVWQEKFFTEYLRNTVVK